MIKDMLWPLVKRYYKLFISMAFVSAIAVALLISFQSTVKNANISFEGFKKDCGYADCILDTELAPRKYADKLSIVDGVEEVNQRVGLAAYMKTKDGLVSTSMMYSYLDDDFYNRFVLEETEKSPDMINVAIEKLYADNNNIKPGDIIELYIYGTKIEAHVSSIVYTPETIYIIANQYLMPDNTGFGYLFIEDKDLAQAVKKSETGSFEIFWTDFFGGLIKNGELRYSNQVLIKCKEGADREEVLSACEKELSKHVKVTSSAIREKTTSHAYMDRSDDSFKVVARTSPTFFYVIVLFIVVMFLNQMVIYMTRDIGILRALGTSRADITRLLCAFSFLMSVGGIILGWIIGIFLCDYTTRALIKVNKLPLTTTKLDPKMVIIAILVTVVVGQIAAVIVGAKASKITPKEAMSNNEGNKKSLSARTDRLLDVFSPEKKLSFCIGIQNPRRVIVSVFSIAAAFIMLFIAFSYKDSKDSIITQIIGERYKFDISYTSTDNDSSKLYRKLTEIDGVDEIETVKYMTVNAEGPKGEETINICGVDPEGHMLLFPNEKGQVGNVRVEKEGIWLNKDQAEDMGLKPGDMVVIEGVPIEVKGLSHDYMNFISAVSLEQMEKIPAKTVTTYLLNVSDRSALDAFLLEQNEASVICAYENMNKDLSYRYRALDILVVIMVVFSILMAVVILVMVAQSSLLEQKRLICTMKVLGFSSGDISRMWLRQETVYTVAGIVVGIPLAILFYGIILRSANSYACSFPIETKLLIIVLCIAIVVATVALTHFLSMRLTRKWNLAESTKDRE